MRDRRPHRTYGRDAALRFMAAWVSALVSLVTLAVGLVVERGAIWILAATVAGFASVVLMVSGVLRRWRGSPTPPSSR